MYLKEYDLSMISDDVLKKISELLNFESFGFTVERYKSEIKISSCNNNEKYESCALIHPDGSIYNYDSDEKEHLHNMAKVSHLLMETQWRDPKTELPKDENEKVIIKYSDDGNIFIITGFIWKTNKRYLSVGSTEDELFNTEYDKINIIGWMPADNVVL